MNTLFIPLKKTTRVFSYVIISLCSMFLFYKYILQVYPGIITNDLMRDFKLDATQLGTLAASFYYAYMITQLFVGVMFDRFSMRWLTPMAIFSCALGVFTFAHAQNLLMAEFSRILMGFGVAFATVAYMKTAAVWFPPRHYALVGGLLATAAMAGAVFGQTPLSLLMDHFGWRESLSFVGVVGFVLAALFYMFAKENTETQFLKQTQNKPTFKDLLSLLKNKQNWLLTLYSGLAFSPIAIFSGLWGNPFLQQAYQVSVTEAASLLSLVLIGLGIGSPLLGLLSDYLDKRKTVMLASTLISTMALTSVLYLPLPIWLLAIMLFTFGFGLGAFMLAFAIGKEMNPVLLTASVIAMINSSDAFLDAVSEPAIGKILDLMWDGKIVNGVHYFSLYSYKIALTMLPLYLLLACFLLTKVKSRTNKVEIQ